MRQGFVNYLLQAPTITALIGDDSPRITWGLRQQGTPLPAIALHVIDSIPIYADEGAAGLDSTRIQVDCWASDYDTAYSVSAAVRAYLSAAVWDADGVSYQSAFVDSEQDFVERAQGAKDLYRVSVDLIIWHT